MKFSRFFASALSLMLVSGEDGVIATPHCSFASSTQYTHPEMILLDVG